MAATLASNSAPLADLNTTPLIDVLLVLLILFVITVPAATHNLQVPLPSDMRGKPPIDPVSNAVTIDPAGTVAWNGTKVSQANLAALLVNTTRLQPEPELRFEPAGQAPYDAAARTLQTIRAAGVSGFGFVGNERYADFAKDTAN
jgi:biopolymer transport protein ExbD